MTELLKIIKGKKLRKAGRCPDTLSFARLFMRETGNEEKFRLLDHIFSCQDCLAVFDAARKVWSGEKTVLGELDRHDFRAEDIKKLKALAKKEIRSLAPSLDSKRRTKTPMRWTTALGASAAAVVIFLVFVLLKGPRIIDENTGIERRVSSWHIQLLTPQGELSAKCPAFAWKPLHEAKLYRVEILDKKLETIFRSDVILTENYVLPEAVFARLRAGQVYFWKVIAQLENSLGIESEFGKFTAK